MGKFVSFCCFEIGFFVSLSKLRLWSILMNVSMILMLKIEKDSNGCPIGDSLVDHFNGIFSSVVSVSIQRFQYGVPGPFASIQQFVSMLFGVHVARQ